MHYGCPVWQQTFGNRQEKEKRENPKNIRQEQRKRTPQQLLQVQFLRERAFAKEQYAADEKEKWGY